MIKCVCCLSESDDNRAFQTISAADKRIYKDFTSLELKLQKRYLKLCKTCKEQLKTSLSFLQTCLKSYEQLKAETPEKKPQKAKRVEELEVDYDPPEYLHQESDDEDEIPISTLQQQLKNDKAEMPESQVQQDYFEETREALDGEAIEETKTEKSAAKFLCPECGVSFKTSQRLQIHTFTHSGIKNFSCDYDGCEKSFATSFRLKAHTRTHTGEKNFKCSECPLSFAQGNALKCHKRIHSKERPFVCSICSKSFAQNTTLKTHMAALHLGKTIECDEPGCNKKFTRRSFLTLHKRDHAGLRQYACDRCPNHYKQKSHLDRHIEATHLGIRHKCDYPGCNSEFSKSWSLKMHKFTHQPENFLPYNCSICNAGFQRRDKWLKHITKSHPEEASNLKKNIFEIQEVEKTQSEDTSNYVVLASTPEIFTIQNADGTFTHVQTLKIVKEN